MKDRDLHLPENNFMAHEGVCQLSLSATNSIWLILKDCLNRCATKLNLLNTNGPKEQCQFPTYLQKTTVLLVCHLRTIHCTNPCLQVQSAYCIPCFLACFWLIRRLTQNPRRLGSAPWPIFKHSPMWCFAILSTIVQNLASYRLFNNAFYNGQNTPSSISYLTWGKSRVCYLH